MVLKDFKISTEMIKILDKTDENIIKLIEEKSVLDKSKIVVINDKEYQITEVHVTEKRDKVMLIMLLENNICDYVEVK